MVHCCFMLFSVVRANGIPPFKRQRATQYKSAVKVEGNPRELSLPTSCLFFRWYDQPPVSIDFCSYRNSMHWWSLIHRNRIFLDMRKENGKSLTPQTFGSKVKHSRILKTLLVLVVSIAKLEHVSAGMEIRVCFFWYYFVINFWLAIVICEYSTMNDRPDSRGQGLLS